MGPNNIDWAHLGVHVLDRCSDSFIVELRNESETAAAVRAVREVSGWATLAVGGAALARMRQRFTDDRPRTVLA